MLQPFTIVIGALWVSGVAADPPPPYPLVSTSISLHPGNVPVVPDADYSTWVITEGVSSSQFTLDGLSFTLAAQDLDPAGELGSIVGGVNDAVYATPFAPYGQRLVGSGVTTAAESGSFKLTISGLPDGQYWLTSWFNAWEELDRTAAVHLTLNGFGKSYTPFQSSLAETVFDASANIIDIRGGTAEVVYRSYRTVRSGNIFFTGFEINGINPYYEIAYPSPANREENVPASNGEVLASWDVSRDDLGGGDYQSYNVYFGLAPDELESVALGQIETEFLFSDLESGETYYWRVDTHWSFDWDELFYSGRTLQFTVA